MKYELNFDAMIFAGEVFQCILTGPGDDFFTDEEKNTLVDCKFCFLMKANLVMMREMENLTISHTLVQTLEKTVYIILEWWKLGDIFFHL